MNGILDTFVHIQAKLGQKRWMRWHRIPNSSLSGRAHYMYLSVTEVPRNIESGKQHMREDKPRVHNIRLIIVILQSVLNRIWTA